MTTATQGTELHPVPTWASESGVCKLKESMADANSGTTLDRVLIAERIGRYGWGFDERSENLVGECFTDDGVWAGSVMGETSIGPFVGRSTIVKWMSDFWVTLADQRRHSFTNIAIDDLTDTAATAYAYLTLLRSYEKKLEFVTAGPYRFVMRKEERIWRIARLDAGFDIPF
ncbi:nuclear transport factor 2 family protein [Ochrobactrum sp. Q0168]|uniref:nuclear transport factor 2 family protein n=1 Tax=Ochrobactrum sp. Q0168 TaxID=2793241 RepID=UPI0018EB401A|nr:nuclear transport factor 2 family protein [Ochrobactrum sp. Q0168]